MFAGFYLRLDEIENLSGQAVRQGRPPALAHAAD
jgi:hypothetical protein